MDIFPTEIWFKIFEECIEIDVNFDFVVGCSYFENILKIVRIKKYPIVEPKIVNYFLHERKFRLGNAKTGCEILLDHFRKEKFHKGLKKCYQLILEFSMREHYYNLYLKLDRYQWQKNYLGKKVKRLKSLKKISYCNRGSNNLCKGGKKHLLNCRDIIKCTCGFAIRCGSIIHKSEHFVVHPGSRDRPRIVVSSRKHLTEKQFFEQIFSYLEFLIKNILGCCPREIRINYGKEYLDFEDGGKHKHAHLIYEVDDIVSMITREWNWINRTQFHSLDRQFGNSYFHMREENNFLDHNDFDWVKEEEVTIKNDLKALEQRIDCLKQNLAHTINEQLSKFFDEKTLSKFKR